MQFEFILLCLVIGYLFGTIVGLILHNNTKRRLGTLVYQEDPDGGDPYIFLELTQEDAQSLHAHSTDIITLGVSYNKYNREKNNS